MLTISVNPGERTKVRFGNEPVKYADLARIMSTMFEKPSVAQSPTGYTYTFEPVTFVPFDERFTYTPAPAPKWHSKPMDAIVIHMRENATRDVQIGKRRVRFEKRHGRTFVRAA